LGCSGFCLDAALSGRHTRPIRLFATPICHFAHLFISELLVSPLNVHNKQFLAAAAGHSQEQGCSRRRF
jgi:hypothetical protein